MLINGKKIAENLNKKTQEKVKKLIKQGLSPKIAVILVGNSKPSQVYVSQKERLAKKLGFDFELVKLSAKINTEELKKIIQSLQKQKNLCGLIVQLPLPKKIKKDVVLNSLAIDSDIDCLSAQSLGQLYQADRVLEPPTAGAVMEILKSLKVKFPGKEAVIIGAGILVGKPLATILMQERATVTVCNSATRDLKKKCLGADIIVTGAGVINLVKAPMVKKGAIVIDAGFSFVDGKSYGDVDVVSLDKKGVWVTPTPGGVGPVTVSKLLLNAALCGENKIKKI
ncbi:MAG TPA: bifunctional 5,10-methylenetetrahydrofolate dehydrogenase/5,10-methenyltetrahydrofolate cyclohydrolase [Candidatus Magasanikbacteria bacterium]|nr:bifunctional 5,10-methylenetetrahydrofolate dehydrogenase/5,10-methenyltetrahydrofolate cyclohydrolase [Candidatus Magasanikbacteria bacterium]